jgi:tetratricopeptide (TPR) repeat protein
MDSFAARLRLKTEPNRDASVIARFYSRALDYWAVQLQKRGDLEKAAAHFEQALELNPANVAAEVSLQCNKNLRANKPAAVPLSKSVTESFGPYRNWNTVVGENGPFDEPNFCYEQGQVFVQGKLFKQAMQQFTRVTELDRTHLPVRLWLAQLYIMSRRPEEALQLVTEIRKNENIFRVDRTNVTELMFAEGSAHLANKNPAAAQLAVTKALNKFETDKELLPHLLDTASQMYLNFGYFSNALPIIDRQLQLAPENTRALVNKGFVCLQLHAYEEAIPPLTLVLKLQTNNYSALLNRAIAYLRVNQLDSARQDYQTLQKAAPSAYPVYYGLAEIAYLKKDTNAAIQNYELYLSNGSSNPEEIKLVNQRLAELRPH